MKLLYFPNKALETKCEPILEFNKELHKLLDEMKDIMLRNNGIGLSANQCGVTKKVCLILSQKDKKVYEMCNPLIIDTEGSITMQEGCLSSPSIYLEITRSEAVVVQYQDRYGEVHKVIAEGIEARCIQHELEHLQGDSFLNRVNRHTRKTALSRLKKFLK